MDRREAIKYISILLGGTLAGANLLTGCKTENSGKDFSEDDVAYLDEIADTILPRTGTPGAKDAKVGTFMALMVNDCYDEKEQLAFTEGMKRINTLSKEKFGSSFIEASAKEKHDLLVQLDREQKLYMEKKKPEEVSHYFRMMKELTLLGYFTSEIGCTKAKRYVPIPGRFEGCIPYQKGDKSFA